MKIKNFLFHRVSDEADQLWPPMPPKLFEEIISFFKRNFFVVSLEEYLDNPGAFKTKKKIATVLFDDGYKDNIEYAAPILEKHHCPASFYIVTNCIDENLPTWTYILDYLFQQTNKLQLQLDFDWMPSEKRYNHFSSGQDRLQYGRWLKTFLKKIPNHQRVMVCDATSENFSDVEVPRNKMMNWDEVGQLSSRGFTIGSHSLTHPLLASIEKKSELKKELELSAQKIKEQLCFFPKTISYPIGSYSKEVIQCSIDAGYTYGLAVNQRFFDTLSDSKMAVPRVELYNESFFKTRLRISGALQAVKRLAQ